MTRGADHGLRVGEPGTTAKPKSFPIRSAILLAPMRPAQVSTATVSNALVLQMFPALSLMLARKRGGVSAFHREAFCNQAFLDEISVTAYSKGAVEHGLAGPLSTLAPRSPPNRMME